MLLYITERSGHHSAALAIKKAILYMSPESQVACVNAFRYVFPFAEVVINNLYLAVIKRVPKIWEKMYDNPKFVRRTSKIKDFIHSLGTKRLKKLIDDFNPDVVLCTQAFPCGLVAEYKRTYSSNVSLFGVLTDFAPHAFWIHDEVDTYIVPADETKQMLVEKGVNETKIKTFGIPIDSKFAESKDKKELFANYGLDLNVPVVMVMGGGRGLGPIKHLLAELDEDEKKLQLIVVCGLNKRLFNWINKRRFKQRVLTFLFTDQIDSLMSMASLIITKPGGITTAECLAKKLPMIIMSPIPGQEARNTQILKSNHVALQIDSPCGVHFALRSILSEIVDQKSSAKYFDNIERLSKPRSSSQIAQLALNP
jgi:processive 1,2-diacylglycerol beta-glucosyltransferase